MNFAVRTRLALWYFAVLMISFALFGWIADFSFRHSVETTIDDSLLADLESVHQVIAAKLPQGLGEVNDELSELSGLWAGGVILEVSDARGNWVFQSAGFGRSAHPFADSPSFFTGDLDTVQYRFATQTINVSGEAFHVVVATSTEHFDQALDRFRLLLKLASPVLIVLASLGGYWLSRRALQPVVEIIRTARSIGVQNLSSRLAVPMPRDELRWLSETLNEMLGRIDASVKRIRQFTADASHELRTPLAVMQTCAEVTLRRKRSEDEYREALIRILATSEKTTLLLENLLQLARADSGADGLTLARMDLVSCAKRAEEQGAILARAKSIHFSSDLSSAPIWVDGDPLAIERLLLILLDNAVKYTPSGGQVHMLCRAENGTSQIFIEDSGIGIGETELPHIFQRFYRADYARSKDSGGAGLGLSIAQWIAERHGGTIRAESAIGKGSLFCVELPRQTASEGVTNGRGTVS
jgi:heavy metal sensor kinase